MIHEIDFQKIKEPSSIRVDKNYDKLHLETRRGPIVIYYITIFTDYFKITPQAKKVYNKLKKMTGKK